MKTGRNDPCPCGSGKKFKQCCLGGSQAAAPIVLARRPILPQPSPADFRPAAQPALPPRPRDPAEERWQARWDSFKSQVGEGKITIFLQTLDDDELMDDEMAFEMLNHIHEDAIEPNQRARFAELVAALAERRPNVYNASAHYYLSWQLRDALADDRTEILPLVRELAGCAGQHIDTVNPSLRVLAYHGRLDALVEAMRIGWPSVQGSEDILAWAISEFAEKGSSYETYDYLEHTASPDGADSTLLNRIRYFIPDPHLPHLVEFIADLTGRDTPAWTLNDFALQPPRKRHREDWDEDDEEREEPHDPAAQKLGRLIAQFVGYLRRVESVPYPKGELIRHELYRYFIKRHHGKLNPRLSMLEQATNPKKKLPPPPKPGHPLCPEPVTFEVQLAGYFGFMSNQCHTMAALFEIVPAWLRFLESRGLIDSERHAKNLDELRPLHASLLTAMKSFTEDPTLYRNLQEWPARIDKPKAFSGPLA